MNNDTRLAVGVHILALLSLAREEHLTSELLARSVNTNPVVIRRLISQMKKAGLIEVRPGVGGALLHRPPETITLLEVYQAVVPQPKARPFCLHQNPNEKCFVGRNIHDALELPFAKVNQAMMASLATITVEDVASFINSRTGKYRVEQGPATSDQM